MSVTMLGKDALRGSAAECYATIDGTRYNLMNAINLEATMEKSKAEVPILGKTGKGNKSTGWKGTGSATFHFNSSEFRKFMKKYKDTGVDFYFDIHVINQDDTTSVGAQSVILKNCNLDSIILTKFDADGEYLDEEINFTFEDWEMNQEFTKMDGYQ